MQSLKRYLRLIKVWESYSGREYGWLLKRNQIVIAELKNFLDFEMFWDSYLIVPIIEDNKTLIDLKSQVFWDSIGSDDIYIENKIIKYRERKVVCVLGRTKLRVSIRGLYIPSRSPKFFDYLFAKLLIIFCKTLSPSVFNTNNGYNNWFTSYRSSRINYLRSKEKQIEDFNKELL